MRPLGAEREIPVDVRVIAATNRDLGQAVAAGEFRQDLYYRLDVMNIHIPPLRARPEDVAPLARHFMRLLSPQLGMAALTMESALLEKMCAYGWPGNARELRNVIERSLILGYFPLACIGGAAVQIDNDEAVAPPAAEESLASVEKRHILKVLGEVRGNKSEAARRLEVSRKTLERKCAEWGV